MGNVCLTVKEVGAYLYVGHYKKSRITTRKVPEKETESVYKYI